MLRACLSYKTAKINCFILNNLCKHFKRTVSLECEDELTFARTYHCNNRPTGTLSARLLRVRAYMYMLVKFGKNRFILAEIINIFLKSKMAAAAILDFIKFAYLTKGNYPSWH